MKFELNGEFIRLGDLLKAAGLTGTGGEAKQVVQEGQFKDQTIEVVEHAK